MNLNIAVVCPDCISAKIVKNGVKKTGKQNLLCKGCSRQFQVTYEYRGADGKVKETLLRMLLRGSGVRDCMAVLDLSFSFVLSFILRQGLELSIEPKHRYYKRVQIDEQWSFVQNKKKKVWMIYAICAESGEILAASWGKRSKKTVRMLVLKLKGIEIETCCIDNWDSFIEVLPKGKQLVGKQYTKKIEGINTWFRTRLRRLMRRTTCFSKKLKYHWAMMKLAIVKRNQPASYI